MLKNSTLLTGAVILLFALSACNSITSPLELDAEINGVWEIDEIKYYQGIESRQLTARLELNEDNGEIDGWVEFVYTDEGSPQNLVFSAEDTIKGGFMVSDSAELILYASGLNFFFSGNTALPGRIFQGKVTIVDQTSGSAVFEDAILRKVE